MAPFDDQMVHLSKASIQLSLRGTIRESGCVALPSQRTLRDYTHYVKTTVVFSTDVDRQLMERADIQTCPEREKYVLDEMDVKQELVYDKQTGKYVISLAAHF